MPWLEVGTMFLSFALEEGLRHEGIESSLPWRLAGVKYSADEIYASHNKD